MEKIINSIPHPLSVANLQPNWSEVDWTGLDCTGLLDSTAAAASAMSYRRRRQNRLLSPLVSFRAADEDVASAIDPSDKDEESKQHGERLFLSFDDGPYDF